MPALTQYFVASSLDGFIADENDNLDWLLQMDGSASGETDDLYERFFADVGALAMGATTYEWILQHVPDKWPYPSTPSWVFTHRRLAPVEGADVRFTQRPVPEVHAEMVAAADGKNVWIVGGGELVGQFLDHGLLDELWVSITPVLLGRGAPLLPRRRTSPMRLESVTSPQRTFVHLRYSLR
ncbi:MAG TPA: dihydrofolate reductase family protein [Nocardioidaceae bacterium]|nr:dihydrofolate reductase family protein [Nocardioidaceae bacterium]